MRVYIQNLKSKNLHKPEGLDWVRETHSAHFLPETWKEGQAPCVHCTRSHFHPSSHGSYFTPRLFRQPYNQSPCSHTWSLSITSQGPSIIHSSAISSCWYLLMHEGYFLAGLFHLLQSHHFSLPFSALSTLTLCSSPAYSYVVLPPNMLLDVWSCVLSCFCVVCLLPLEYWVRRAEPLSVLCTAAFPAFLMISGTSKTLL